MTTTVDWKLIESAPKDRLILLCDVDWPPARIMGKPIPRKVGGWREDWGRWEIFGASWAPTHWAELPEPPAG